ncbi:MAG TPA: hypothetical protein VKE42_07560, partial [Candidatus Cybelea sp.]|nr:hypothetical protein [Candidatus Cybelea sp.]
MRAKLSEWNFRNSTAGAPGRRDEATRLDHLFGANAGGIFEAERLYRKTTCLGAASLDHFVTWPRISPGLFASVWMLKYHF